MRFQIEKNDFQRLLKDASTVAPSKSPKPIYTHVLLEAQRGVAGLRVTANDNSELVYSACTPAAVEEEGKVCVQARDLLKVVTSLPVGVVNVSLESEEGAEKAQSESLLPDDGRGRQLVLKAGRARFALSSLPASEFPPIEWQSEDQKPATLHSGELLGLLNATLHAVSFEETRYYLGGCFFEMSKKGDALACIATDGHRLSRTEMSWDESLPAFLCPRPGTKTQGAILGRRLLVALQKILESNGAAPVQAQVLEGRVAWFEVGDIRLQGTCVEGSFPDYRQVVPAHDDECGVLLERISLIGALQRVSQLSPDKTGGVRLRVLDDGTGTVELTTKHTGRGSARETVEDVNEPEGGEMEAAPREIEVGVNAFFLLDALKAMKSQAALFTYTNNLNPMLMRPSSRDGEMDPSALHVIMPMRL